jgi:hypothetical protein
VLKNTLATESVDEGGSTYYDVTSQSCRGLSRAQSRIDIPVPEAPQTIRQNWIPFFTFFFFRSIFYVIKDVSKMHENRDACN